ncbi:MAG: preprotein translocase subunit SecG [Clostridia bacterium]|nr:preprotein translocase subunit SecG [Clostridia bacterium]
MATVLSILLIIVALFVIVTVLLQSSDDDGMGALSGRSNDNSYFSRSKAKTMEARLALGTKIGAAAFVALSILMLIVR